VLSDRIDRLIRNYHLQRLRRAAFPKKIEGLAAIGISIPSVIHELIIDPRNELEHEYLIPDPDVARRATDVASLFIAATDEADLQESIVAINSNYLYAGGLYKGQRIVKFEGWSDGVMVFIDIFNDPHTAKIVDGQKMEVCFTQLQEFSIDENVKLGSFIRRHYSLNSRNSSATNDFFYAELQRQAGF
jgi:hypothetical protein